MSFHRFAIDLYETRQKAGLSLRALAGEIAVPRNVIWQAERGSMPRTDHFLRLCEWIGVDPGRYGE